jgi:DNA-binding transcriptional ArsR family regulator
MNKTRKKAAKAPSASKAAKRASPKGRTAASSPRPSRKRSAPDPRLVKALAHPLRMRLLARLNEAVLSPAELAREFDASLPLVSYHVGILRDLGCLELVRETPVRGAVEHHYRATRRAYFSDAEWSAIDLDGRQSLTGAVVRDVVTDALDAFQSGQMDRRHDRHVTFTTLNLDETAWKELNALLDEVLDRALTLQAESAARQIADAEVESLRSRLTLMHYQPVPERPSTGVKPARTKRAKRPARK